MKKIIIDCASITTSEQFHSALKEALELPSCYGGNLDALYDCLTSLPGDTEVTLTDFSFLPAFADRFRRVLTDAQEDTPGLTVLFR